MEKIKQSITTNVDRVNEKEDNVTNSLFYNKWENGELARLTMKELKHTTPLHNRE